MGGGREMVAHDESNVDQSALMMAVMNRVVIR